MMDGLIPQKYETETVQKHYWQQEVGDVRGKDNSQGIGETKLLFICSRRLIEVAAGFERCVQGVGGANGLPFQKERYFLLQTSKKLAKKPPSAS